MPSRWRAWFGYTVSPLHMNLQAAYFQDVNMETSSTSGMNEIAACLPSPVADNPSALPS